MTDKIRETYWERQMRLSPEERRSEAAARNDLAFRHAMRAHAHTRWQRGIEFNGHECPIPAGTVASVWRKTGNAWCFLKHPERHDWSDVKAYRLEHGTPYSTTRRPEPAEQSQLDRIEQKLDQLLAIAFVDGLPIRGGMA